MDVVDRIVDVPRDKRDRPLEDQVIEAVVIEPLEAPPAAAATQE
jgi:hypothetical protein